MRDPVYVYPKLGRTGLGNMLFPWARAELFRDLHGVAMLAPMWTKPRLGTFLRRERDSRLYLKQFRDGHYVSGLRRELVLRRGRIAVFDSVLPNLEEAVGACEALSGHGPKVVAMTRWADWFTPELRARRSFIIDRLLSIVRPEIRAFVDRCAPPVIGLHVRRGDKVALQPQYTADGNPPLDSHFVPPVSWFARAVQSIRRAVGEPLAATVFSDGHDEELTELLELPGVQRAPRSPAIADILMLSRSGVLVTSATSSFSGWAAFLGGMPTLWYPRFERTMIDDRPELLIRVDEQGSLDDASASRLPALLGTTSQSPRSTTT